MQVLESTNTKHKEIFWKVVDRHYLTLWDARDLPKIDKWCDQIRHKKNDDVVYSFYKLLDRKWDDHRTNLAVEPLDLSLKDDVMTFRGIAKMCRLVSGQDTTTFTYGAVGTGAPATTNAMPYDQSLVSEQYHGDFAGRGFFDATGTSIRYGLNFGALSATANYNESLVRNTTNDGDSGRITLCITFFNDQPISHTSGNTGFTAAGSIEFTPIADIDFP